MEIDPTAIRQRIDDLEAAGQRQWDIARANSRSFDYVYGSCAEADFARAAELRQLIGLPTRTGEADRVVEKFNLVEAAKARHVGRLDPRLWPDGTIRLPDPIESWLDGHFDGEKDDDAESLSAARNVTAVALWSLIYRQGDPDTDQAALDALQRAASKEGGTDG